MAMRPLDDNSSDLLDFDRLLLEYGDRIYGAAFRITGSAADAEDVLQETFLEAYEHRESFRGVAAPTTWLYRIAVNAALQRVRQRRPVAYLEDTGYDEPRVIDWSSDLQRRVEITELRQQLERGIAGLAEDMRVVVVLRDVEGLSAGEVSQVLDISEAAVKSRLHRGRVLLRQFLSGYLQGG
jgi:RNA polymerase sigma-70 factor, ECF subfamily